MLKKLKSLSIVLKFPEKPLDKSIEGQSSCHLRKKNFWTTHQQHSSLWYVLVVVCVCVRACGRGFKISVYPSIPFMT